MLLPKYWGQENLKVQTIIPIAPYGRMIGTTMEIEIPQFHFDPDPLYRETVLSQGWDPEKDVSPGQKRFTKEYAELKKQGKEWLAKQKRK